MGACMYRSICSRPWHYLDVNVQLHASIALHPGKALGWVSPRIGGKEESCSCRYSNSDPSAVQPVTSRYSYCTVLAVLVGNNRLSHSISTFFICFRLHRRYYTTVELELSYSLTLLFLLSLTPFPS
jgi:hypothetical protein